MSIYVDNASTTFLCESAYMAYTDSLRNLYGNPSSVHSSGFAAFSALEEARNKLGELIGCLPEQVVFTSGGSESDNLAIYGAAARGAENGKKHIVSSAIEHHAVLEVLGHLEKLGFEISYVMPDEYGIVSAEAVAKAIRRDSCLVTVMYANNEVGTVQPISEIAKVCREHSVAFHTDAVQAVGHILINASDLNVDLMSLSAHKFHGPKGIGALYVRDRKLIEPLIRGGMQESGFRAGTENLPAIISMTAALEDALSNRDVKNEKILSMRERLIDEILKISGAHLNGDRHKRLPGNANFCFEGIGGEQLVLLLDSYGIEASSGSACSARMPEPSHVLRAMRIDKALASSSLRISIDEYNTEEEITQVINKVTFAIERMRNV